MTSPHDTSMTWEGRRCGGFLTTQNQGQLGNLLNQTQKQTNQAKQNHFSSKSKRNQGMVHHALGFLLLQMGKNSKTQDPSLLNW